MANRIYRGPVDRQPHTVSDKPVAGAYMPGTFVLETATNLTQATTAVGMLRILADRDFYGNPIGVATAPNMTAYASGDTGVAYIIEPAQEYQAAVAAATYAFGQELTVAAGGRLAAAATGNPVVAFCKQADTAAAGALIDVEIADRYTKAA